MMTSHHYDGLWVTLLEGLCAGLAPLGLLDINDDAFVEMENVKKKVIGCR